MRQTFILNNILLAILLTSCSKETIHNYSVSFRSPDSFVEKTAHAYGKNAVKSSLVSLAAPTNKVIGLNRQRDLAREFLTDIGGVALEAHYIDGEIIDGFYFDPALFKKAEYSVYKKWRLLFKEPKNNRLAEICDIDLRGSTLATLFHLPKYIRPLKELKGKAKGVLCFPAMGIFYEFDPQMILSFLIRGFHVVAVNYRGIIPAEEEVVWEDLAKDASIVHNWMQKKTGIPREDILCYGKSFGSSLALYASLSEKSPLMIDRGFARLSSVCKTQGLLSAFTQQMIENYYRFPNEDLIKNIQTPLLIVEASGDTRMKGEGEKLFSAYAKDPESFIKVSGSHFGIYWGDSLPTWYSDEKSQEKVDKFLKKISK